MRSERLPDVDPTQRQLVLSGHTLRTLGENSSRIPMHRGVRARGDAGQRGQGAVVTSITKRGYHPLIISLIGALFAAALGTINFLLTNPVAAAWNDLYVRQHGYAGETMFLLGNFFFEIAIFPIFLVVIFSGIIPFVYAKKRNMPGKYLNARLFLPIIAAVIAFCWLFLGNSRHALLLAGISTGLTSVFGLVYFLILNWILLKYPEELHLA
jgi:hypothetical protein